MHEIARHRIILLDANDESRAVVARRLSAQGYACETFADAARGADVALSSPPAALVADLWMPDISGVQLCRLLRAEPATMHLPIILRGQNDDPRSRFWAEHAGATAYVLKGRVGDLVRTLAQAAAKADTDDGFFMQLSGGSSDVHQRIARHLDLALFDSVIAAEVRSLASCGSFEQLFDHFCQFLSRVVSYRWMAIVTDDPKQFGLHHHPRDASAVEAEARAVLKIGAGYNVLSVEDEDARIEGTKADPSVYSIPFGPGSIGRLALAVNPSDEEGPGIAGLAAR
ncbi:MAG TPA: response regulator, partial [Polyangiaceae bacterium]